MARACLCCGSAGRRCHRCHSRCVAQMPSLPPPPPLPPPPLPLLARRCRAVACVKPPLLALHCRLALAAPLGPGPQTPGAVSGAVPCSPQSAAPARLPRPDRTAGGILQCLRAPRPLGTASSLTRTAALPAGRGARAQGAAEAEQPELAGGPGGRQSMPGRRCSARPGPACATQPAPARCASVACRQRFAPSVQLGTRLARSCGMPLTNC